ncbi:MAG: DUF2298 domain-containing protein [Anaerolineae bacterium]
MARTSGRYRKARSVLILFSLSASLTLLAGCAPTAKFAISNGLYSIPVENLPVVADRAWNTLAAAAPWTGALSWYLLLLVLGWMAWPPVAMIFPNSPDSGYTLAKGLGLLFISYLLWMGASLHLWMNSARSAWLLLGVCLLLILALFWKRKGRLMPALRADWRLIILEELVFLAIFCLFLSFRLLNPDLWHPIYGGEKTMELGILNALSRSAYLPPYDPFFAGGVLNYYYFGYFICNTLLKLTGIAPQVGFNLCIPTFAGLFGLQALHLGGRLAARLHGNSQPKPSFSWAGGASALVLVLFLANLNVVIQFVAGLAQAGGAPFDQLTAPGVVVRFLLPGILNLLRGQAQLPAFDYWNMATRIIPWTINEFPFFTYLFADLHPHLLALPLTVLVLNLLLAHLLEKPSSSLALLGFGSVCALALGALGPTNTWDLPTYGALVIAALTLNRIRTAGWRGAWRGLLLGAAIAAAGTALFYPYYVNYSAGFIGLAWVPTFDSSPLGPWLVVWGWQLFLGITWLAAAWPHARYLRRLASLWMRAGWRRGIGRWASQNPASAVRAAVVCFLLLAAFLAGLLLWSGHGLLVLFLTPLAGAALTLLLIPAADTAQQYNQLLFAAGWLLLWAIELVYLRDFLDYSAWRRMNTVFKFGLQAWVLLGLALGSALPWLWQRSKQFRWCGAVWRVCALALGVISLAYLPLAVPARITERFSTAPGGLSLDGSAFMRTAVYNWPPDDGVIELSYDLEAIDWLNANVVGTPVLAEAPLGYYREFGTRVAAYTGLPTLTGLHAQEQHPVQAARQRELDEAELYTTLSEERFWEIVRQYNVRYIYLGQLERNTYPGVSLSKFAHFVESGQLELAHANERTAIYRVREQVIP